MATKIGVAQGGTGSNLSATGGTSQVLKQIATGANITVGQLTVSDISGAQPQLSGTGFVKIVGTTISYDNSTYATANSTTAFTNKTGAISQWTNDTGYLTSIGALGIDALSDVTISSVTTGNFLRYNGTAWINAMLASGDIPNLDTAKITTGNLAWSRISVTPTTLSGYGITDALLTTNNLSDLNSAATARTNLGGTTLGKNLFTISNPSAITFPRFNADNTVDALSASAFRTAIGAGTGSGSGDLLAANNLSDLANAGTARTNLGLVIGTNVQAYDADLTIYAGITPSANVQTLLGAANYAAFKTSLSLGNVENTALSTWAGTANITTLGTIATGIWNGTAIADAYISSAATWNAKQAALSGTGFIKATGSTISYDNSTYLTTVGGTTVGNAFLNLTNPSAITFARINADNTVTALSAASFRSAIGAGTGSGTGDLLAANNLSELTATASTARTNLGFATLSNYVDKTVTNTYTAGAKQVFVANGTTAGLKLDNGGGDPSVPSFGDLWVNSANGLFRYHDGSATRTIITADQAATLTGKAMSGFTMIDATNIVLTTTTGTKIGTATSQKLGFFNSTPVIQQSGNIVTGLSNLGLVVSGSVSNANLDNSAITINGTSTSLGGSIDTRPLSATLASDQTSTIGTMANVTSSALAITAGQKYWLHGEIYTACGSAGGGVKLGLNTAATVVLHSGHFDGNSSTASNYKRIRIPDLAGTSAGVWNAAVTSTIVSLTVDCFFTATTSGTLYLQFASQTGGETSTIQAGTTLILTKTQ